MMLLLSLALLAGVLCGGVGLFVAGLRAGDRSGETLISNVDVEPDGSAVCFVAENPGDQAVLVGASVRRASFRLRCEGGAFVSIPRATTGEDFLAGRHAVIHAVAAGERVVIATPVSSGLGRHGELVVAIGEQQRLKVVHRAVDFRGLQTDRGRRAELGVPLTGARQETGTSAGLAARSDQPSR